MNKEQVKPGSLITSITISEVKDCPMVVYEVNNWGVKAQIQCPGGVYPFRISHGQYTIVGEIPTELIRE